MVRHIALVAAAIAIAIVVVGGLPGRRVERDEAKCYVNVILYGPDIVTHMNPFESRRHSSSRSDSLAS